MNEFQPLIDQLYRQEVLRARKLGPKGRLREGFELMEKVTEAARKLGSEEMARMFHAYRENREQGCYGPPFPR